jgi:large subunit ribosomal protein L10
LENPRPEKVAVVTEVRERFDSADAALLTEYRGLSVTELAALRRSLRESGAEYKVYKNTLVRRAANDAGITELETLLVGPTAIAFVNGDAAVAAKALKDFARTAPALVIKGGLLGKRLLSPQDASALAELPSREVLLARLAGGLAAPMQKFAGLLQALPRNFAYGLSALIEKGGAPGAPQASTETAAPAEAPETTVTEAPETVVPAEAPETAAPVAAPETPADTEAPEAAPAEAPESTPTAQEATPVAQEQSTGSEPEAPAENSQAGDPPAEKVEE